MLKNRLLLSIVALVISAGISLLVNHQNFSQALVTGLITVLAALIGVTVADNRTFSHFNGRMETLKGHIRALQRRRAEVYESMVAIAAERDRISTSINSLQMQLRQLQIQSANLWQQKEELSWNLAAAPPAQGFQGAETQSRLQELERQEVELNRSLSATLAAKQRSEAALETLQKELDHTKTQILDLRATKEALTQEIAALTEQKQQLTQETTQLQAQTQEMERYRSELNQFLVNAEPRRQQVETSSKTLQGAIEQLQLQISSLHLELGQLENQILERRTQKDKLDQEITNLKGKKTQLQTSSPAPAAPNISEPALPQETVTPVRNGSSKKRIQLPGEASRTGFQPGAPTVPEPTPPSKPQANFPPELPADWMEFMVQLPEPEMQALKAIAEQRNPSGVIKKIAESTLTMPELLIDALNERALETIGDIIVDPGSGSTPPTIAAEHREAVRHLIQTYEALTAE